MPEQWLMLLHQIPPKPAYLRAKVLRRLNQLGALPLKNSAYLLPRTDETVEDTQWVCREISQEGGEAWVFECNPVAGLQDGEIREDFRRRREQDYRGLLETGRALLEAIGTRAAGAAQFRRLKQRYEEVRRIDFFGAPGSEEMEALMKTIDANLRGGERPLVKRPDLGEMQGRVWVTRRGIKVDRMGSAWLIGRFLDPTAQFRFVDPDEYVHREGEVRFDMFEGEFTHEGDLCTFEVLVAWSGWRDAALEAVAQVVHDIDLKDAKYGRPETAGIAAAIHGLTLRRAEDTARLEDGGALFESLYNHMKAETDAAA
jgi:hypothetical protein